MAAFDPSLAALADHLAARRDRVMAAWRSAVDADAALTTSKALPRAQLNDHIPTLLDAFETQLRGPGDTAAQDDAAAHGLHRWQQGFGLEEVSRELGHLNECVVDAIDACAGLHPSPSADALTRARKVWAHIFSLTVSASTTQYVRLQQMEAASYVKELEMALRTLRRLERERAAVWQQAAHDLRGNLGVVANAAAGLGYPNLDGLGRDSFMRMLERNMQALHKLLDDFTCLARLQGGQEERRVGTVNIAALLTEIGGDMRSLAVTQGLTLDLHGEPDFTVEGDAVKIHRIVQNLVLNAIRYTGQGGVTVSWGPGGPTDPERWFMEVLDTGPGYVPNPSSDVFEVLKTATTMAEGTQTDADHVHNEGPPPGQTPDHGHPVAHGEGIGLSIVKRLCELLDATIQVESKSTGTRFRILSPCRYNEEHPSEPTP
ncbi:MAG: sensor histidine kinase [Hydrogenophaga sp.]